MNNVNNTQDVLLELNRISNALKGLEDHLMLTEGQPNATSVLPSIADTLHCLNACFSECLNTLDKQLYA